jgi:hypothetical protein
MGFGWNFFIVLCLCLENPAKKNDKTHEIRNCYIMRNNTKWTKKNKVTKSDCSATKNNKRKNNKKRNNN